MSFEVSRLTKIEARGKKLQKCMSATSGFWSDFKNWTKSKNKGHFIIATSKVTIIKWPLLFDLVKFLLMKLKSLEKLQKCMSATSGFWMFRPF